jgi:adenine-specific DNA methylase
MTDSTPKRKPVFIEKVMPVKLLNKQVYYEHGGNPFKGLHRWYSRKPLSFCRASVLGSLLPADVTMEEFEYLLGLEPGKEVKLYKTPPSSERIRKVQDLCEQYWETRSPTVLDAFAGGGSIPFEAARYGLNVLASDLNPVAVVTMKAAMEYPLKFGPDLQADIDKWVKWVGDEAEKRLAPFFPSLPGETVQNYLWAHTVICPNCESMVPLSQNWWVDRSSSAAKKGQWCAVKPIPDPENKRVGFEMVRGKKGKNTTIQTADGEYDPETNITINRGEGKCLNCGHLIESEVIDQKLLEEEFDYLLYAVGYKQGAGTLKLRLPTMSDLDGIEKAKSISIKYKNSPLAPSELFMQGQDTRCYNRGVRNWQQLFNPRQLFALVTYVEIINEAKLQIQVENSIDKSEAIIAYLSLVLDRCADKNSRLSHLNVTGPKVESALGQHSLNLMWNYPETNSSGRLWEYQAKSAVSDYSKLCSFLGTQPKSETILTTKDYESKNIQIVSYSADNLTFVHDKSVDAVVTDPPYYSTLQYAELSDFFYIWLKRTLNDVLPELFLSELTDKDREAVANPSRFRNMGLSPQELANSDYEAKMSLAFSEYYRVLRDDGVMTVQFNHKDSGAWDVLAKSLIEAGFEITASWSVSTENPQNLHQAQKNSVASTVLLVCRKRDPNAGQAWWDDLRPQVANLVEQCAPEFEANDITGIDLYLSAFGPALNVFSQSWPVLDSSGRLVHPDEAFTEARRAIANYRFRKLAQTDTAGFDPLTQWYILAWDAFRAREFPFDEARQLALAVGGFNVADLAKTYKLLDSTSGTCKLLTPQQRFKKRAFSLTESEFSARYLVDGLHAIINPG